ncbi:WD40 repeat domain-containing protein [Lentzea terrae]|uniref:WD40 repeat domain-containing protein n=1 Tax=Lentzea terrae TaxID=2200761 RepID=UPI001E5729D6|nr:WD40 repeat domain-containing protein [Lentzea terrae]
MPRRERPLEEGDTALLRFAADLRQLRKESGSPTYRELSRRAHYAVATLSAAAAGRDLPSLAVTLAYVTACGGDAEQWRPRWQAVASGQARSHSVSPRIEENGDPPYVGLAAFQAGDARFFFGRERLVADLLRSVNERRFVGVFGASGSGKSSILRAGLVAATTTPVLLFAPGPRPLQECAVQLAGLTGTSAVGLYAELAADPTSLGLHVRQLLATRPGTDLLIVVDQFEEVFTVAREDERAGFVAALVHAAEDVTSRTRVVLGVRADFYGHCGQYPELVRVLRDSQILVGQMTPDELRAAITKPAVHAGAMVESALVTRLVADTAGQPGVLPLLSHALLETWRRRRGATLTVNGYEAAGGIQHAIARTAEDVCLALDADQLCVAKQIFLRLTTLDGDTKRRVHRREFDQETSVVLDELARARLLTLGSDDVEIAHEALLRCWPRLRDWLAEDREGRRIHRALTDATDEWTTLDRDPGALYRGARLSTTMDWAAVNDVALTTRERAFLDASRHLQVRQTRRLRQVVVLLAVVLLMTASAVVYAALTRSAVSTQRDVALASRLVWDAKALRATTPALAVQLGLAAHRLAPSAQTRDHLLSTFATPYATRLTGHTDAVSTLAYRPDGALLASAGVDRTVRLWRGTREVAVLTGHTDEVRMVTFSPDGRLLASAGTDRTVRLWDGDREVAALTGHAAAVHALAFSPDGRTLVSGDRAGRIRVWDVAGRRALTTWSAHAQVVESLAFSPDGRLLATGSEDNTVRLWDPRTPVPLATLEGHTGDVTAVAFSPDGRTLATGDAEHAVFLWDTESRTRRSTLDSGALVTLAFSPDGTKLATGGVPGAALWDVGSATLLTRMSGHTGRVHAVTFSPDGSTLATASRDRTVRLEDVGWFDFTHHNGVSHQAGFSPDGRTVVTTDKVARLWDSGARGMVAALGRHHEDIQTIAFSRDGRFLATAGDEPRILVWDLADPRRPPVELAGHDPGVLGLAFGRDGTLTSAGLDRTLRVWDLASGRELHMLRAPDSITAYLGISADGRVVITVQADRTLRLWQVDGDLVELAALPGQFEAATFSSDGRMLAAAGADLKIRLWDVADLRRPLALSAFGGHTSSVDAMAFSADGRTLATAGTDMSVKVWDVTTSREIATLTGHTNTVSSVAFSPNGQTLVTSGLDRTSRIWDLDPERAAARVCEVAWPRITEEEWEKYLPGIDYSPPCK